MTIHGFGPVEPSLDHLVYAVPDLDAATRAFAAATGVVPAEGGAHVGRGTRNVLVGFGETSYLEIIGPDPDHPAGPRRHMPFGVDTLTGPRLVTWAVHPADLDTRRRGVRGAGADHGAIGPLSRRTPDGALLEWRLTHRATLDGIPRSSSTGAPPPTRRPRCPGWRCAVCGPPIPIRPPSPPCSTRSASGSSSRRGRRSSPPCWERGTGPSCSPDGLTWCRTSPGGRRGAR